MTALPKHLRPRWRYLAVAVETWPAVSLDRRGLQGAVWSAARDLLGDPGSARADLTLLEFTHERGYGEGIVRIRRGEREPARAAIACVSAVEGDPVGIRVVGSSGTVRGAREKYLGRHRQPSGERIVVFEDEERTAIETCGGVDLQLGDSFAGATDLDLA